MRIAYLVSRYPAISHTFILREVLALRRLGAEIETFSVRRTDPHELLSAADREAFATTETIVPPRPLKLAADHAAALVSKPLRYAATLLLALRLSPPGARGVLWQVFYFVEAIALWRRCEQRDVRHVHAHFANVATDVALLAAEFGGERWSWSFTMHGSAEFYDVARHRLREKVERADLVVCISHFSRSQLMGFVTEDHWPKLRMVHCGVDPEAFRPVGERNSYGGPTRILHVGRLVQVKGHAILLHALAELARCGLDITATLVGDGPKRTELEQLAEGLGIAEKVTFTGSVGQDEIRSYYAAADIFCLPSFAEGVPVVLMEAMASGLPVVATRVTGIPELVEAGVSGLLATPGRTDEIAAALRRLAESPELRTSMGRAGRGHVIAEFELSRSAEKLGEIFGGLLRETPDRVDHEASGMLAYPAQAAGAPVAH
ncbi:MAG: glycosyltransferase family 4 protein [Thermoleophilaceae bacterium]|nr:glycosyltransferase family 4 protein [Thermoleophilaceae bacterium]